MGKKLSLNEEKFKVAFIFLNEGCNPKKDRSVIESKKIILYSVGCADYSQAETVAQEMLEKGCAAIGAVNFDFHPVFRDKSGDDLFQKDFWCIGL